MSAVAAPRVTPRAATSDPRLLRGAAFFALALFAGLHWATLVAPSAGNALFLMTLVAMGSGVALAAIERRPSSAVRILQSALVTLAVLWLILLLASVPGATLRPDHWDRLAVGIGDGLAALPGLRIPYRGADEWTRAVIVSGGGLLLALAAWLALAARRPRPLSAAICIGVLYTVPIIEQSPRHPYLDGAMLALLLAGFIWADRLRGAEAPLAVALVVAAVIAGAIVAPRLDAGRPWIDYEAIAESLQAGRTTTFSWNHTYGPITWPRDGREIALVKSRRPSYWKAETLEQFDGEAWRQGPTAALGGVDSQGIDTHPGWVQRLEVTVRGLRSTAFVAAGTTLSINNSSKTVGPSTPGTFRTLSKPLRRGDSYTAISYVPRPDEVQMRTAGTDYPSFVRRDLTMDLPDTGGAAPGASPVEVTFPAFRSGDLPVAHAPSGFFNIDAETVMRQSPYWRMYRLAQQLAAGSSDPWDFVRRVQNRVQQDARYTEQPPDPGRLSPLVAFLFRDHAGYCQHFSGAMALLLRMGGVPARIATGFSPGSRDGETSVVRDVDAHSWVEVYFPGIGWATFDPTPADSPARSQIADLARPASAPGATPARPAPGDRASDPKAGGAAAPAAVSSSQQDPLPFVLLALLVVLLSGGWLVLRRRGVVGPIGPLDELHRALVRSGRSPTPDLTIHRLEKVLGGSPEALAYLRALRLARYADRADRPTPRQRRALRVELGAGLGLRGRLRAAWALPPRPREVLVPFWRRRTEP